MSPAALAAQEAEKDRKCLPAPAPEVLPALDRLLDSAVAVRALTFPATNPLYMKALLTLHFQRDGTMRRLVVLEHDLGEDTATVLARIVAPLVRTQEATDAPWGARLRVQLADHPTITVERARFCPPVQEPRRDRTTVILSSRELNEVGIAFRTAVRVFVTEHGAVESTELKGEIASATLRDYVLERARSDRYKPALLDGYPVAAWFEQRLNGDWSHRPR